MKRSAICVLLICAVVLVVCSAALAKHYLHQRGEAVWAEYGLRPFSGGVVNWGSAACSELEMGRVAMPLFSDWRRLDDDEQIQEGDGLVREHRTFVRTGLRTAVMCLRVSPEEKP